MPVMRRHTWIGLLWVMAVLTVTIAATSKVFAYLDRGVIPPGYTIAGVSIGGLNEQEAAARLEKELPQSLGTVLHFVSDEDTAELPMSNYGIVYDYQAMIAQALELGKSAIFHLVVRAGNWQAAPILHWNDDILPEVMVDLKAAMSHPPREAKVLYRNDNLEYVGHQSGYTVDEEKTTAYLKAALNNGEIRNIKVELKPWEPEVKLDDAKGIKDLLSIHVTLFDNSNSNRTANLKTACQNVDGTVILPGKVFSLEQALGPRTEENGYKEAGMIVNNRIKNELGGGICQVATTIYNAAVQAGLEVIERKAHSQPITYAPPGLDATIAEGESDLKIKNNSQHPVMISLQIQDNKITARIFGINTDKDRKIQVITDRQEIPPQIIIKYDNTLPQDSQVVKSQGRSGYKVKTYRVVIENNKEVERKLLTQDYYPSEPMIILVGSSESASAVK